MDEPRGLTEQVKVRIEPELKAGLEREAMSAERTPAAIARRAIREYLIRKGQLAEGYPRG